MTAAAPTVRCCTCVPAVDDRKGAAFVVNIDCGGKKYTAKHRYTEFEKLYERCKHLLIAVDQLGAPPKKRLAVFGGGDAKLAERRRLWLESMVEQLLASPSTSTAVRDFLGIGQQPTIISQDSKDDDENGLHGNVDLGPSERVTAKPDDFEFLKTVGKGSFGRVYLARHKCDQQVFAMKVLGKAHIKKRNEVKHVMSERNVLILNMKHPFLVGLHYSFQTRDKLYFVLDYLNGGELFFHLQREKRFSEPRARFYSAEIASALGYLHERDIIYRDLKPENLLLDRFGHVVLTDFGLCKEGIKAKDTTATFCGTPEYLAPEIVLKKPYDRTVDWWCLGSVLYEMLFGLVRLWIGSSPIIQCIFQPPFYSKDHNEMYEKIVHQQVHVSQIVSMAARDVLQQMLQKDRAIRLGAKRDFAEVKEHAFFLAIDWDKLLRREVKPLFVPRVKDELDVSCIDREFTDQPLTASLIPASQAMSTAVENDFAGFSYVPTREEVA